MVDGWARATGMSFYTEGTDIPEYGSRYHTSNPDILMGEFGVYQGFILDRVPGSQLLLNLTLF